MAAITILTEANTIKTVAASTASATDCINGLCISDGNWNVWCPWSGCSTRAGCKRTRGRVCNNIVRFNGGKDCVGDGIEAEPCYGTTIKVRNSQNNDYVLNSVASTAAGNTTADAEGCLTFSGVDDGELIMQISATGFITRTIKVDVVAHCELEKLVIMSPTLDSVKSRIVLMWGELPKDIDTHVVAIRKYNHASLCKTYYVNFKWCDEISLDLKNTEGGLNGAETVTLQNSTVNSEFYYLIGIHEYNFGDRNNNGYDFLKSSGAIDVFNGEQWITSVTEADTIDPAKPFYIFGCLTVIANSNNFTLNKTPAGTFINGTDDSWRDMLPYCIV